jgi:outer membrane protein OmpA-like peptidoglycan-associated protein/predicted RNA-binding protein with TRAM domain
MKIHHTSLTRLSAAALTVVAVAALTIGGSTTLAGAVSTVSTGTTVTDTYAYTGATETLTVPANVFSITLSATGAEGGQGGRDSSGTAPAGGYQGVVTGTFAVTPGQILTIGVGQGGADSPVWNTCSTGSNYASGDPSDAVGGTNPLGGFAGGAGGSAGNTGCSGYGGSGGAASVVEIGTSIAPTSVATIVAGGSGGSGGSGQFAPTQGQISLPTYLARSDATASSGQDGESVYTACHQVSGQQCDGGGGAGGGGGAQGGSQGLVEFGSGTSDEWFGLGGYPGLNSTSGISGLSAQYSYYANDNANGSVVISYSTGVPSAPSSVVGAPGNSSVSLYWTAPTSTGDTSISNYVVQYATSPYSSWTTATMCTGTITSCTVTGLSNGTAYEFQVAAVNTVGQGSYSAPSSPVTPTGPPSAPSITTITPSDGSLSVAFTPPSSTLAITDYQYSVDGGTTWISGGVTTSPLLISGLTNGTTYPVEIRAISSAGNGNASAPTNGTPSALPGAPTITSITPGGGGTTLAVDFLPGYTGGSPITSYQYATSIGADTFAFGSWTTASGTTSPVTITGLSIGTTYSVELRALNVKGNGPASVYANGVTLTVPNAPTITSIVPGDATLQVNYTPFTSSTDGGSAISGIEYSLDGGSTWTNAGTLSDPFAIPALTNGTLYSVLLRADNGVGAGNDSTAGSGTPLSLPGAPTQVQVVAGPTSAQATWVAPASNGGSVITGYTASAYAASSGGSATATCTSSTLTCSLTGLTNDTTYYVSVVATNAAGTGAPSTPRVPVMPVALPGAPTLTGIAAGNSYLQVTFTAGTQDANAPVTAYQYSLDSGATWQNATGTLSPITVSGLTNGTSYTVQLRAQSVAGPGAGSNGETGTPYAAPDATNNATTSYTAASGQVTPNNNGAAIAGYTVTAFTAAVSGSQQSTCSTTTALSCTLTGLTNGTTYYVSIQSVNVFSEYSLRSPRIPVVPGTASSVTLVANPTSSTYGTSVTLSATVTTGATGTVNFEVGGVTIGTCGAITIVSNAAQCVTTALPVGTPVLMTVYSGDSHYASSDSTSTNFTVSPANQSALTITSTSTSFVASPGNSDVLTTTGGSTAGVVSYVVSPTSNTAGCSVSGTSLTYSGAGSCSITATMAANSDYSSVSSSATTFTVNQGTSATGLAPSPTSSTFGVSVTLTATVSSGATGTVNFKVGGTTIASCGAIALVAASAACVTTTLPAGIGDSLTAVYSGNGNYLSSTSSPVLFNVGKVSQTLTFTTTDSQAPDLTSYQPKATSSSGLTVLFSIDSASASVCTLSGVLVHFLAVGVCTIDANQPGDATNAAAVQVQQFVTVTPALKPPTTGTGSGPSTPPSPPLGVTTSTTGTTATVSWTAPTSDGGSPITSYVVTSSPSGLTCTAIGTTSCTITGLKIGTVYSFSVQAVTAGGSSATGAAPQTTVLSTPTVTVTNHVAVIHWKAPPSVVDGQVTGYKVTLEPGNRTCDTVSATTCTITGVASTRHYHVNVAVLGASGTTIIDARGAWTSPVLRDVYFDFGSFALTRSSRHTLSAVAHEVVTYKMHDLRLAGHTDDVGSASFNLALSGERARTIASYLLLLVHRQGYRALTIHVEGLGISKASANAARDRSVTVTN